MLEEKSQIISKLIWIDAKVNNNENKGYQNTLKKNIISIFRSMKKLKKE